MNTDKGAFFGNPKTKGQIQNHQDLHPHKMAEEWNIPLTLAFLAKQIHLELKSKGKYDFLPAFLQAISDGADLSLVTPRMILFALQKVLTFAGEDQDVKAAVETVITLYERLIAGHNLPQDDEWSTAARVAVSATEANGTYAAARAATAAAAAAAAARGPYPKAAAEAVENALEAAYDGSTGIMNFTFEMQKELLNLLADAPLVAGAT